MADVVIQAQSTNFARQGETWQWKGYTLPSSLAAYIQYLYSYTAMASSLFSTELAALYGLMIQNSQIIPGGLTLYDIQNLDPTLFTGAADLQAIYQQDPFSTEYETSTQALYDRAYLTARNAAQSGPSNIRGGTARMGFELAELDSLQSNNRFREIWQNQLAMAEIVVKAIQVANAVESEIRNEQLKAQQLQAATEQGRVTQTLAAAEQLGRDKELHLRSLAAGGEFLSLPYMKTSEALQGEGPGQGSITTSFGMTAWR